jgi:hypothetical protein
MRTLPLDDPRDDLVGLRLGIQRTAELIRVGSLDVAELHSVVEADLAALWVVSSDVGAGPGPEHPARQANLDAVASHLLAAVDASMSGVRPEVVADLLWRAADRLRVAA